MAALTSLGGLVAELKAIIHRARYTAFQSVNREMLKAYFNIGRKIVREEQKGKKRAEYGAKVLDILSAELSKEFGRGFSRDNLEKMRKFYLTFPKSVTLSRKLSWSHYCLLLRLEDKLARDFYMVEAEKESWSVRELDRQINALVFERITLSKDKKGVLELSKKGQVVRKAEDIVKEPYVLEFLNLEPAHKYTETTLEEAIIDNLKTFLLELGKGFMFVARQQRITIEDEHFYVDLVFYNRLLRCFVILEIKIGKLIHQDLGQLQMYVHYYNREIKRPEENPTIGILLCADKKEAIVRYTLPANNKHIFASQYKLYLPRKEEILKEIRKLI